MISIVFRYLTALLVLSVAGIIVIDFYFLPIYVGANSETFLPDIKGEYQNDAVSKLSNMGFDIKIITIPYTDKNKPGVVIEMFPNAFTKVKEEREITISIAGHQKDIILPNLENRTLRNAKIELVDLGLNLDTIMYEFNTEIEDGYISFQIPPKGKLIKTGASISLGVSKGGPPDYFIVPDLINYSLNKATEKLQLEGLRVGEIEYEYQPNLLNNTVVDQGLPPGLKITMPMKIDLIISKDLNEK